MPREITKPRRAVVFDDASNGDYDIDRVAIPIVLKLSKKCIQKLILIMVGRELDAFDNMVARIKKGDESFSAANINREIHILIIA